MRSIFWLPQGRGNRLWGVTKKRKPDPEIFPQVHHQNQNHSTLGPKNISGLKDAQKNPRAKLGTCQHRGTCTTLGFPFGLPLKSQGKANPKQQKHQPTKIHPPPMRTQVESPRRSVLADPLPASRVGGEPGGDIQLKPSDVGRLNQRVLSRWAGGFLPLTCQLPLGGTFLSAMLVGEGVPL